MEWGQLLWLAGAGLAAWLLHRALKHNPGQFSAENMIKSLGTMGWLALGLIAFITFCVIVLRQSA